MHGHEFDLIQPDHSARLRRDAILAAAGLGLVGGGLWWLLNESRTHRQYAPGAPGATPRWNFAGKDGVGTAMNGAGTAASRVWFTIRHGAFTEIFYPRVDRPAVRELHLIVTNSRGLYADERSDAWHQTQWVEEGIPAFNLVNTSFDDAFRIEKTVLSHPLLDVVLQATRFVPHTGTLQDYRLFAYLSPHLGRATENAAWIGMHKGMSTLFAKDPRYVLALACSTPWIIASAGYVGRSDGLADLRRYGTLVRHYDRAERGNVALIAEIDLQNSAGEFLLALGFGATDTEAGHRSRACLLESFDSIRDRFISGWRSALTPFGLPESADLDGRDLTRVSMCVLQTHEDAAINGAIVASLSTPWGEARDDNGTGEVGYHIVWPRDAVECGGALLAVGSSDSALRILRYLHATQEHDGHWAQNFWVDGATAWDSNQMGEAALPILLLDLVDRERGLDPATLDELWPMVRTAASYIVKQGPSTLEDRWEDAHGFTPYTISALVSALLIASFVAEKQGDFIAADFLRATADNWCDSIEYWTYVKDTSLSRRVGVSGYYIRVAPSDKHGKPAKRQGTVDLWYEPMSRTSEEAALIVSPDALAYVRFGLRAADDPRIVNTVKVIDATLRVGTPFGPCWYRSTDDGYGEKRNGAPFDNKQGIGRLWPLLTGERAHYELAAGRRSEAIHLMHAMESFANFTGLIPEQVWDTDDIPERGLYFGRPSGSAMPLAWAHAEYLKLRRSLIEGRIYDMHPEVHNRYVVQRVGSPFVHWRANHRRAILPEGKNLRIELRGAATIRWRSGHQETEHETSTIDSGLGIHFADLETNTVPCESTLHVKITRHEPYALSWEQVLPPNTFTMSVEKVNPQESSGTSFPWESAS
jgi:glucoamylase